MAAPIVTLDPLLGARGADALVEVCERFGSYGLYSQESVESEIGHGLAQRHDAVLNFLRTGGRSGSAGSTEEMVARTNYFREEYAYGDHVLAEGIEPFLHHAAFVDAARAVHGRDVVEPAIVYANILVPGQELTVHTDVPEFRGANRKVMPQWLLVAMHHSGLFEDYRMPIATGVAWFHDKDAGGEFAVYPNGPDAAPTTHPIRRDTAMVLDTDSVFHGVDRVGSSDVAVPSLRPGMTLDFVGDGRWTVHDGGRAVCAYDWDELRFSVSWKAYCFADEGERAAWHQHRDDLGLDTVLDVIVADLAARGIVDGDPVRGPELGLTIIDTYIRFPPAVS